MDLIKTLASKLGVVATPEAIAEAADQLVELRGTVAKNVGLTATTANNVLLKAILDDASVRAKYVPLLSALGVENPDAALDKIATMMADSAKLAEITPEFAALKTKASEEEAAVADEDVEAAVETTGVQAESEHFDGMKIALSTLRKTDRKKFDEKYPKEKLDLARKAIAARKAGIVPTVAATSRNVDVATLTRKIAATGNQQSGAGASGGEGGQIDVSQFEGANTILRTCSYVKASVAGAKDWSWDKVHEHATTLVRSKAVTG